MSHIRTYFIIVTAFILFITTSAPGTCDTTTESGNNGEITFHITRTATETVPETDETIRKHYLTALGGVVLANTFLSSWNRYVSQAGWADVTWEDLHENFTENNLAWDTDWYWTNFVLHPYQGSLYYMAARGSNLNQLESFGMTLLGDFSWEYMCETNAPSKNDLIYSALGGFALGEMLYRLSIEADEINRMCGYLINPMRPYTEFVTGERARGTSGNIYDMSLKFAIGTTKTYSSFSGSNAPDSDSKLYPVFVAPEFGVVYNDPYGWDSNTPYSQFELNIGGAFGAGDGDGSGVESETMYNITIFSNGMLFSRAPDFGENKDTTVGFVLDYDFMWHSFMELSALSPGVAIKQRIRHSESTIEWQCHANWLLLGTSDYYYFRHDLIPETKTRRDYSYNTGFESVVMWKRTGSTGHILDTNLHFYAMYDFPGQVQENACSGWDLVGLGNLNYEVPVSKNVNIGLGNSLYLKKGIYYGVPDVSQTVYTGTVFTRLKMDK